MIRPILSYSLVSLILLSQVGLPVHMHYCKGMLEAISVFVKPVCDDHAEIADLPSCCQKSMANHCSKEDGQCCDDETKVLTQDITSLLPHLNKWADFIPVTGTNDLIVINAPGEKANECSLLCEIQDTGPPIYILHQALIYYA